MESTFSAHLSPESRARLQAASSLNSAIVGMATVASRSRTASGRLRQARWTRTARLTLATVKSTS